MKDSDARGLVLNRLYELRDLKPNLDKSDFADLGLEIQKVGSLLDQLNQKGLVAWHPAKGMGGSYIAFMARISAEGVDVIEGNVSPPLSITYDQRVTVQSSQGVQIGGQGNVLTLNMDVDRLNSFIDSADASVKEKEEAKSLLKKLVENPLVKAAVEWWAKVHAGG
jgi:hypothetical protein